MYEKIFVGYTCFAILFNLTSCYRPNTIFRAERSDLYAVTCFSVPYIAGNPNGIKYLLWNKTPKDALYINILPTPNF